ncbi:MAG: hypothetical protein FJZ64_01190 [Chlamydiae bacterium]|nr:hypothetical protein [Chlamydiota bacterium]
MEQIKEVFQGSFMALRETMQKLDGILTEIVQDLGKAHRGNQTAAQRVRVGTVKLERVAKLFRKESVAAEKSGRLKKLKERFRKKKRLS